jgi:hypothetical protein
MASIAARAAFLTTSKSSNKSPVAETIASPTRSTYSGAARIAGSLSATLAQNVPKAALQRPANSIGSPGLPAHRRGLSPHQALAGDVEVVERGFVLVVVGLGCPVVGSISSTVRGNGAVDRIIR